MAGQARECESSAYQNGRSAHVGSQPVSDLDPTTGKDEAPCGRHATAAELEERLLKRLDELYTVALARLAGLGHG
jgi:hypothetical protein